ncbi:hypothetical protein EDD17DRAFT_639444 [Pisolithus thermaeus]|nr:hypothetical protein EV401DRAFT_451633 [Pisolithus croceorrhizus]KAI6168742.1 hypothetical protein EDD17DRAFT_639444 [Pisolithus thermaeus]
MCGVDSAAAVEYPLPVLPALSCGIYAIDSRKALPSLIAFMKNAFIRALNHVYTISMRLPSGDPNILHFLMYAKSVVELLQVHLDGDRSIFTTCSDGRSLIDVLAPISIPISPGPPRLS